MHKKPRRINLSTISLIVFIILLAAWVVIGTKSGGSNSGGCSCSCCEATDDDDDGSAVEEKDKTENKTVPKPTNVCTGKNLETFANLSYKSKNVSTYYEYDCTLTVTACKENVLVSLILENATTSRDISPTGGQSSVKINTSISYTGTYKSHYLYDYCYLYLSNSAGNTLDNPGMKCKVNGKCEKIS